MTPSHSPENQKAVLVCLFGILLHMALSDPLLHSFGWHYSGEEGEFYEKIHPGTVFIFISLFMLIWGTGSPIHTIITTAKEQSAFVVLFIVYVVAFFYMAARSGFAGLAFIIDGHMSAVICAIVLSHASPGICKKAVSFFIFFALINGLIGIAEATWKFRIFTFDDDWAVLNEEYFRASAFLGHPLDNAIFTALALLATMATRYASYVKIIMVLILLMALMAFGGRFALVFSALCLIVLVCRDTWQRYKVGTLSMTHAFLIASATLITPLCLMGLAYFALKHGVGERIADSLSWDKSADSRRLSFLFYRYMTSEELWLGVSAQRVIDITYRMSLSMPILYIENPWIIMCMYLGLLLFPLWCIATLCFARALMKNQPLAIAFMVLAYFVIATTSNSFGHKDECYAIMVSVVICAARMFIPFKNSGDKENDK